MARFKIAHTFVASTNLHSLNAKSGKRFLSSKRKNVGNRLLKRKNAQEWRKSLAKTYDKPVARICGTKHRQFPFLESLKSERVSSDNGLRFLAGLGGHDPDQRPHDQRQEADHLKNEGILVQAKFRPRLRLVYVKTITRHFCVSLASCMNMIILFRDQMA